MAAHLKKRDAKSEAAAAFARHIGILDDVEKWCIQTNSAKEQFFYLSAIPIIYSAWEGYFRIACAVCLKRLCVQGVKVKKYGSLYSTLWLQQEKFLDAFLKSLVNTMTAGKEIGKVGSGKFTALSNFSEKMSQWLDGPLDHALNFDDLVMTYSNVNTDVARINASVIGLDLSGVNFSRLNELLGRRNDISHGGLINYPQEATAISLLSYARDLLAQFDQAVQQWIDNT